MAIRVTGKSLQAFLLVLALAIVGLRIYAHSRFETSVNHHVSYGSGHGTAAGYPEEHHVPETPSPTAAPVPNCMVDFNPVLCGKLATEAWCQGEGSPADGDAWAGQYVKSVCPDTCRRLTGQAFVCEKGARSPWPGPGRVRATPSGCSD